MNYMNTGIEAAKLTLRHHKFGRIDHRLQIGPVTWPFHDLLWVHEGIVMVKFPDLTNSITLTAPAGVLILPNTRFYGHTTGTFATASVCHFEFTGPHDSAFMAPGFQVAAEGEHIHLQNLVRLAMYLARRDKPEEIARRQRLLRTILDGFEWPRQRKAGATLGPQDRLAAAWGMAADNLQDIRTLSDVAALIGITESGFRTLHRRALVSSAGEYLRDLRLNRAEELLATTGFTMAQIARQIGYRHVESFSAAFRKSRGMPPGHYRRWSKPFA